MDSKNKRLTRISEIIQNKSVTSQDQLLKDLLSNGFSVTQATLSRDLKQLKVSKMPDNDGTYRYLLPEMIMPGTTNMHHKKHTLEGFVSIEFSDNIGIIKTIPAFSQAISSAIDSINFQSIAGTLAGDDTIIFIIRKGHSEQQVRKAFIKEFPELIDKLI